MGNYVESNLLNGETIVYEAKHHWMIWAPAFLLSMVWMFAASREEGFTGTNLLVVGTLSLLLFLGTYLRIISDVMAITNKRLILKTGLISRNTFELQLSQVETIRVKQSIFGRLLGYGTIVVRGTGSSVDKVSFISNPIDFRNAFLNASDKMN